MARQIELDGGAVSGLAVDRDVSAGLLDEAVDLAQSESGALTGRLGGEERVDGARDHVRRHA